MGPNEIFEYVSECMKWLAIGGGTYIATLVGLSEIPTLFSERIHTQEDLDRITSEESKKLGMTKCVTPRFYDHWEAGAAKLGDGTYEIHIGGFGARRSSVRHELYHVHKGHFDFCRYQPSALLQNLDYLFRQEPQAIVYEAFRLKL